MWSAALVSGIGNLLAQILAFRSIGFSIDDINFEELLTYTAVGGLYFAPLTHLWFHILSSLWTASALRGLPKAAKAAAMVAVDQTLGAVAVNTGFLFIYGVIDRFTNSDLVMRESPLATIQRRMKQLWPLLLVIP